MVRGRVRGGEGLEIMQQEGIIKDKGGGQGGINKCSKVSGEGKNKVKGLSKQKLLNKSDK